jgi:hypothetical protein
MSKPSARRCTCGQELQDWRHTAPGGAVVEVWAASIADLVQHWQRRPTEHDVLDRWGQRLQRGTCAPPRP